MNAPEAAIAKDTNNFPALDVPREVRNNCIRVG